MNLYFMEEAQHDSEVVGCINHLEGLLTIPTSNSLFKELKKKKMYIEEPPNLELNISHPISTMYSLERTIVFQ